METLNKLLGLIPGNGYKTSLGLLLSILALLQALLSTPDGVELIRLLGTRPIDWIAISALLVGLIHKYIKVKQNELK